MGTRDVYEGEPKPDDWLTYVCAVCGGVGRYQGRQCPGCVGKLAMRLPLRIRSEFWCNLVDRYYVPVLLEDVLRERTQKTNATIQRARVMGTRDKHPVTFTCEYCGYERTELHGPGPIPRYCQGCYAEAQAHLNRQRVKAHRARQRAARAAQAALRSTEQRSR